MKTDTSNLIHTLTKASISLLIKHQLRVVSIRASFVTSGPPFAVVVAGKIRHFKYNIQTNDNKC